jgi:hypothetical protein
VARKVTPASRQVRKSVLVKAPDSSTVTVRLVSGSPSSSWMLIETVSFGCHPVPVSVTCVSGG